MPWFLAPCDLQALKASGVTFVSSMLERVIEEQARGNASKAESVQQAPGQGFTHEVGDMVTVFTETLGTLVNRVNTSDKVAPWTYGVRALMQDLAQRRPSVSA